MGRNLKSILTGEFFYLLLAQIIVMLGVVGRGILYDKWYTDYLNIFLIGFILYGLILLLRGLIWISRKMRKKGY